MNRFKATGFTLIEAMVVIAIIGILMAIAFPSYQRMIERNRLKQVAESLKSDMQFARAEAIKRSKNVIVSRTAGNNGTWCYGLTEKTPDTKTSCDCAETDTANSDYCEIKRVLGSSFNTVVNMSTTTNNNTFDFRRGTFADGNVTFSTTNFQARVVYSWVGRIRNCTPSGQNGIIGYSTC
jgi:type IV fimbrial biogenesis protein FimT